MSIDKRLFEAETGSLIKSMLEAIDLKKDGNYDEAIECLDDVIISAGLIAQKDSELGKYLGMNEVILVARGYQLSAYALKLREVGKIEQNKIVDKMESIVKGKVDYNNSNYCEIMNSFNKWINSDPNSLMLKELELQFIRRF